VQEEGGADVAITVDEQTTAKPPGPALAPACNICDYHHHLRPYLDQLQPSPDPDALGKLHPCETLAGVELSRVHAEIAEDDGARPSISS
jgi:hypothetical protein